MSAYRRNRRQIELEADVMAESNRLWAACRHDTNTGRFLATMAPLERRIGALRTRERALAKGREVLRDPFGAFNRAVVHRVRNMLRKMSSA